ncbi:hevamine-A precursor, putative [Ricinus communis]|uniref:chitinase n=1 Tax=Ricinus communis TaxID=3988 RepID=B9RE02_RICCO|nr:hevamine-A precursor, putative [Ricinus communis]
MRHRQIQICQHSIPSYFWQWPESQINLAGHCDPATNASQKLSKGIRNCQNQGVKVMLSIGGGQGNYSLSSNADARNVAEYLGKSNSRPLGGAVLDGIDFDIENGDGRYYPALVRRLSELRVYLTAAPQCPFPDRYLNDALSTSFSPMFGSSFTTMLSSSKPDNFKNSWNKWTSSVSASKFFVGLPASRAAAGDGYVTTNDLKTQVLPFVKSSSKYGGVMISDKYNDDRTGYSSKIKDSV